MVLQAAATAALDFTPEHCLLTVEPYLTEALDQQSEW